MDTVTIDRRQARQPSCSRWRRHRRRAAVLRGRGADLARRNRRASPTTGGRSKRAATTPAAFQSYGWCRYRRPPARRDRHAGRHPDHRAAVGRSPCRAVAAEDRTVVVGARPPAISPTRSASMPKCWLPPAKHANMPLPRLFAAARKLRGRRHHPPQGARATACSPRSLAANVPGGPRRRSGARRSSSRPMRLFDDYYKTVKAKTRKNIRNARHRFERVGAVTHSVEWKRPAIRVALRGPSNSGATGSTRRAFRRAPSRIAASRH